MASLPKLSEGAIETIMRGGNVDDPVLQVLSLKKMAPSSSSNTGRYRCFLSDGKHTISFALMNADVYAKGGPDGLPKHSVIKVKRLVTSVINNTGATDSRVLLVLDIDVVISGDELNEKIGHPVPYTDVALPTSNGTTRSAPPPESERPEKRARMENVVAHHSNTSMNSTFGGPAQITHPIASLTPYQNKWVIKARIANKSQIRTWSNSKGEGKLFSLDLVDESGEIRMTFFRDQVDKYYDQLQIDKVYYITKCQLKPANKQFSSLKNDYEMTCHSETCIEECMEEDIGAIPQTKYDFTPIAKIQNIEPGTCIDVIGIAKTTSDLQMIVARSTGRELKKKDVVLVDKSNAAVNLALWNAEAENFDGSSNPVIVIKGAKIGEFGGGKNLSTSGSTVMKVNPEMPEAYQLKGWYDSEGNNMETTNISTATGGSFSTEWKSFQDITDEELGHSAKGDYFLNKGTILLLRSENCLYKACPNENCNKKVVDMQTGMYRCEKCNREFPTFMWRLLLSMNVGDYSGNQWISMFSEEGEKVIGMSAQELGNIYEESKERVTEIFNELHFTQFIFKCRAKVETYNDESRLKTVAVKIDPIDYESYNAHLCVKIEESLADLN